MNYLYVTEFPNENYIHIYVYVYNFIYMCVCVCDFSLKVFRNKDNWHTS